MNNGFTQEACDMGNNNSNTIPGRCKLDCSGLVPQATPTCTSITVNPNTNPLNQGTNANIICNATNASFYDITVNNGLIPDTNGVSQYLFGTPGVFNINCTVWNADYSQSASCPAKVVNVQSTAPQCQSFTATPNPVQVGQPVTMVCDGNQFSNTYQILVQNQNNQLVSSFNGGLPGPNNTVTTTWTPNAPGTYTMNCAVSNNNTQVAQCPGQTVTVLQPGQPDLWITKSANPNQVASG